MQRLRCLNDPLYLIIKVQYWYCTGQYCLVKNIHFQIMLSVSMETNNTASKKNKPKRTKNEQKQNKTKHTHTQIL